ncbi:MAG: DUF4190 domain-containing protein [Bacteroidota bacterium]
MNRLFFVFLSIVLLGACSQRQFSFRQKVRADKNIAKKETTRPDKKQDHAIIKALPYADSVMVSTGPNVGEPGTTAKKSKKPLLSASIIKEILPFSIEQLSPEERAAPQIKPNKAQEGDGGVLGYISLTLGILSIFALLSLVFISSNMLGVVLLFSAPVLGALALILGIVSVSENDGKGMGWAGIVMGSFILLITLVFVLIAYLLIQSSVY